MSVSSVIPNFTGNLNQWQGEDVSGAGLAIVNNSSGLWTFLNSYANVVLLSLDITYPTTADGSDAAICGLGGVFPWGGDSPGIFPNGLYVNYTDFGEALGIYMDHDKIQFYKTDGSLLSNADLSGVGLGVAGFLFRNSGTT